MPFCACLSVYVVLKSMVHGEHSASRKFKAISEKEALRCSVYCFQQSYKPIFSQACDFAVKVWSASLMWISCFWRPSFTVATCWHLELCCKRDWSGLNSVDNRVRQGRRVGKDLEHSILLHQSEAAFMLPLIFFLIWVKLFKNSGGGCIRIYDSLCLHVPTLNFITVKFKLSTAVTKWK